MDDRELLERAARAIGCTCMPGNRWDGRTGFWLEAGEFVEWWNPLQDDGAAFRLMNALRLTGSYRFDYIQDEPIGVDIFTGQEGRLIHQERGADDASVRRAIVRAAAAMEAPMNIGQMRLVQDSPTLYRIYSEDDFPPFEECLLGEAERGDDGFFRFFPSEGATMACHHLKHLAKFIGDLNE